MSPEPVWTLGRRDKSLASAVNRTAIRQFQLAELIEVFIEVGIFLCLNSLCFAYSFESASRGRIFRHIQGLLPSFCLVCQHSESWMTLTKYVSVHDYFNKKRNVCFADLSGRSLAGIVDSNPAGGMEVCFECCLSSGRGLCLITRPEKSYRL